jgi:hypothetical protein
MTQSDQSDKQIAAKMLDGLIQCAYDILADGKVTFGEVVTLGGVLASKVNQFEQLSGLQKQAIVLDIVERALQRVLSEKLGAIPEELRDDFRKKIETASSFAKDTLPSVLTLAVQASRGQLNLAKVVETVVPADGPLSCLHVVLPLLPCMRAQQATPSKAAISAALEMSTLVVHESSKEPPTLPTEEESKVQESREASTVAQ